MVSSNSYDVASYVQKHKYKIKKKVVIYKSPTYKATVFILKVGDKMNVVSLDKNGKNEYIKVKNSKVKYGYIKVQSKLIVSNPLYLKP